MTAFFHQGDHAFAVEPKKAYCELAQVVTSRPNGQLSCAAQGIAFPKVTDAFHLRPDRSIPRPPPTHRCSICWSVKEFTGQFWLVHGRLRPPLCLPCRPRATILSASSGNGLYSAFASFPRRAHPDIAREASSSRSTSAAPLREKFGKCSSTGSVRFLEPPANNFAAGAQRRRAGWSHNTRKCRMRLLGIGCRSRSGKGLDSPSPFPAGTKGSLERRLRVDPAATSRAGQRKRRRMENGASD